MSSDTWMGSFYFHRMEDKSWLGLSRWSSTQSYVIGSAFQISLWKVGWELWNVCHMLLSVRPAQLGPVRALGQTALFLTTYISHILFNKCQGTLAQLREMVALICKWVLDVTVQNSSLLANLTEYFLLEKKKKKKKIWLCPDQYSFSQWNTF